MNDVIAALLTVEPSPLRKALRRHLPSWSVLSRLAKDQEARYNGGRIDRRVEDPVGRSTGSDAGDSQESRRGGTVFGPAGF
jgi:hypothetical protein